MRHHTRTVAQDEVARGFLDGSGSEATRGAEHALGRTEPDGPACSRSIPGGAS